jgi:hypothetical protein
MPHPCPHHCPPEGGGGIIAVAIGVLAVVFVAAAVARPVIHALEVALEIVVITVGGLASAALFTIVAMIAVRVRRRQLAARPPVRLVSVRPVQAIPAAQPRAIGAARTSSGTPTASGAPISAGWRIRPDRYSE